MEKIDVVHWPHGNCEDCIHWDKVQKWGTCSLVKSYRQDALIPFITGAIPNMSWSKSKLKTHKDFGCNCWEGREDAS